MYMSPFPEKGKKEKWLSVEALQIAEKRREVKSNGDKERYTHLNAEFQRTARKDKAFLCHQCLGEVRCKPKPGHVRKGRWL